MSRRDDRPIEDRELGIPWDEMQFATWLMVEGGIKQSTAKRVNKYLRRRGNKPWVLTWDEVDHQAARFARVASQALRDLPSHRPPWYATDVECPTCGAWRNWGCTGRTRKGEPIVGHLKSHAKRWELAKTMYGVTITYGG